MEVPFEKRPELVAVCKLTVKAEKEEPKQVQTSSRQSLKDSKSTATGF